MQLHAIEQCTEFLNTTRLMDALNFTRITTQAKHRLMQAKLCHEEHVRQELAKYDNLIGSLVTTSRNRVGKIASINHFTSTSISVDVRYLDGGFDPHCLDDLTVTQSH